MNIQILTRGDKIAMQLYPPGGSDKRIWMEFKISTNMALTFDGTKVPIEPDIEAISEQKVPIFIVHSATGLKALKGPLNVAEEKSNKAIRSSLILTNVFSNKMKALTASMMVKVNNTMADFAKDELKAAKHKQRAKELEEYATNKLEHSKKLKSGEIDVYSTPLPEG
jgi:hypothetical protein